MFLVFLFACEDLGSGNLHQCFHAVLKPYPSVRPFDHFSHVAIIPLFPNIGTQSSGNPVCERLNPILTATH